MIHTQDTDVWNNGTYGEEDEVGHLEKHYWTAARTVQVHTWRQAIRSCVWTKPVGWWVEQAGCVLQDGEQPCVNIMTVVKPSNIVIILCLKQVC